MKIKYIILLFIVIATLSCDNEAYKKPTNLVPENEMVNMLADMHIAEATYKRFRYKDDNWIKKVSSTSFYRSILEKYDVSEESFEQSYLYYVSRPKKFEKIYSEVTNKLNAKEDEYRPKRPELENRKVRE